MKRIEVIYQHGSIYQGKDVERFINWFAELPVGSGVTKKILDVDTKVRIAG